MLSNVKKSFRYSKKSKLWQFRTKWASQRPIASVRKSRG